MTTHAMAPRIAKHLFMSLMRVPLTLVHFIFSPSPGTEARVCEDFYFLFKRSGKSTEKVQRKGHTPLSCQVARRSAHTGCDIGSLGVYTVYTKSILLVGS